MPAASRGAEMLYPPLPCLEGSSVSLLLTREAVNLRAYRDVSSEKPDLCNAAHVVPRPEALKRVRCIHT